MQRTTLGIALLTLGLASTGCCHYHKMRDLDNMVLHAQNVDRQFVAAFNKADIDNVMDCYWHSPELTVFPPDAMEAHGWDAAKAAFQSTFKAMPGAKLVLIDAHYEPLGDTVQGWGTWTLTAPVLPAPGNPVVATELHGRYTEVIARQNGKWVYILDHASVPLPPTTAPATK